MKDYKISIIIPIYNVEDYIVACVDSIINQTYQNYELILVDDCSTDDSITILKSNIDLDFDKISILKTNKNSGLSMARNFGLPYATGDYVWFVDSDDFISSDALEILNQQLSYNDFDIVIFNANLYFNKDLIQKLSDNLISGIYTGEKIVIQTLIKSTPIIAWNKLYSRELLTETRFLFPEGLWYEDTLTIKLFTSAKKIKKIDDTLYYYRQREGSITKVFSTRLLERYEVFSLVKAHLRSLPSDYEDYLQLFYGKVFLLETLNNTFLHGKGEKNKDKVKTILTFIEQAPETLFLYKNYLNLPFSKQEKLLLFLYFKSPYLYKYFYLLYKKLTKRV